MKGSVLVVDDSKSIAQLVSTILKGEGYRVHHAIDADEAFTFLKRETVDLALLDIDLPGISGVKLLEILKQEPKTASVPVIMLTVKADEGNKVKGLTLGADDYIVKPFSPKELVARVEALLRRVRNAGKVQNALQGGGIVVDLDRRDATVKGKRVALTEVEFQLLAQLLRRKGHVLTNQVIAEALSGGTRDMTSSNVYVHIKNLRDKLGPCGELIETVYGSGYRFVED